MVNSFHLGSSVTSETGLFCLVVQIPIASNLNLWMHSEKCTTQQQFQRAKLSGFKQNSLRSTRNAIQTMQSNRQFYFYPSAIWKHGANKTNEIYTHNAIERIIYYPMVQTGFLCVSSVACSSTIVVVGLFLLSIKMSPPAMCEYVQNLHKQIDLVRVLVRFVLYGCIHEL